MGGVGGIYNIRIKEDSKGLYFGSQGLSATIFAGGVFFEPWGSRNGANKAPYDP